MAAKLPNLDGLSVEELTALIVDAEAKRSEKLEEAKTALLSEIKERAAALGMSLGDLQPTRSNNATPKGRKPRSDAGKTVAAKFRGPDGAEWSGRGRPPAWLVAAEAAGKSRDEFRI